MRQSAAGVEQKSASVDQKTLFLAYLFPPSTPSILSKAFAGYNAPITWGGNLHYVVSPLGMQSFAAAKTLVAQLAPLMQAYPAFACRPTHLNFEASGTISLSLEFSRGFEELRKKISAVLSVSTPPQTPASTVILGRTAPQPAARSIPLTAVPAFVIDALTLLSVEGTSFGALHRFPLSANSEAVAMDAEDTADDDSSASSKPNPADAINGSSPVKTRPASLSVPGSPSTPPLEIGTVLLAKGVLRCELAWAGQVDGRPLLGVVYDGPKGDSDGTLVRNGELVRCFTCPPRHGEFLEPAAVAVFDAKVQAAARIQRAFRGHFSRQRRRELINQEVWNLLDQKRENETLHARDIYARLAERFRKAGHHDRTPSSSSFSDLAHVSAALKAVQEAESLPSTEGTDAQGDTDAMPPLLTLQHQDSEMWSPPLASPGGTRLPPPRLPQNGVTLSFVLAMITHFRAGGLLHPDDVAQLLTLTAKMLETVDNIVVLPVYDKITVCGDIHGQLDDLCFIFNDNGLPSETNPYLFNGDFVDRGQNSCECVMILFAFKLLLPTHFHLNRGNHESQALHRVFGFEEEVVQKYGRGVYDMFIHTFARIPIAHVVQQKVFVVHGGPPVTQDLPDIARMPPSARFHVEVEDPVFPSGFREMLWNDPQDVLGARPSDRGCGYTWGPDVTAAFLHASGMELLVRAHEIRPSMFASGYQVHAEHGHRLITLFSASNYCGRVGNHAAFAVFRGTSGDLPELVSFMASARDRETFEPHRAHRNDVIEADIIAQLSSLIADHRVQLRTAFEAADTQHTGLLPRLQTENILLQVLGLPQVPLFLYADALGLPVSNQPPSGGMRTTPGGPTPPGTGTSSVAYLPWLDTFRPVTALFPEEKSAEEKSETAQNSAVTATVTPETSKGTGAFAPNSSTKATVTERGGRREDVEAAAQFVHAYRGELETLFQRFDSKRTGFIQEQAFADAVTQLNETQGCPLSTQQVSLLVAAFQKLKPEQRKYESLFRPLERPVLQRAPSAGRPQLSRPAVARAQSQGAVPAQGLPMHPPVLVESRSAVAVPGRRLPSVFPRAPSPQAARGAAPLGVPAVRRQLSEPARKATPGSTSSEASAPAFFRLLSGLSLEEQ